MLTSLYLHVPFCNQICTYCDFHKEIATTTKKRNYMNALCEEIKLHKKEYTSLSTIYIGGGTPSSLDLELLETLLQTIKETIDLTNIIEYSMETNPNDITEDFAKLIFKYGINRVSIGVQTFNQKHLTFLGRTHSKEDVFNSIKILRNTGFQNISIDMMFSLIHQTMQELEKDVNEAIKLGVEHISYYSLILEEKTTLSYLYKKNNISLNSNELEADMYEFVINRLAKAGYIQYEISNFSKGNHKSLHNLTYWHNLDYLGLGSGSHSKVENKRFFHATNVTKYINDITSKQYHQYEAEAYDSITDEMILGLRLIEGVSIEYINNKYQIDLLRAYPEITDFINSGHLKLEEGYLALTTKGLFVGNEIFMIFVEVSEC